MTVTLKRICVQMIFLYTEIQKAYITYKKNLKTFSKNLCYSSPATELPCSVQGTDMEYKMATFLEEKTEK